MGGFQFCSQPKLFYNVLIGFIAHANELLASVVSVIVTFQESVVCLCITMTCITLKCYIFHPVHCYWKKI